MTFKLRNGNKSYLLNNVKKRRHEGTWDHEGDIQGKEIQMTKHTNFAVKILEKERQLPSDRQ